MQDDTLLTRNMCMPIRAGVEKNMWSKNKERAQTLWYSSLEEPYFWVLTHSFTFSVLGYRLF